MYINTNLAFAKPSPPPARLQVSKPLHSTHGDSYPITDVSRPQVRNIVKAAQIARSMQRDPAGSACVLTQCKRDLSQATGKMARRVDHTADERPDWIGFGDQASLPTQILEPKK